MIRALEEKDLSQCLELLKELTVVGEVPNFIEIFKQIKNNKIHHIFVYELEDKIVGMATLFVEQKFIHSGKCVGHIEDVVVSEKYRGMGIGKLLVEKCVQLAKENNCYKVILDCDDKNVPFYSKLGFSKFGNSMKIAF